jgi:hypothetical protein
MVMIYMEFVITWFSLVSSTNKTEILLKVALSTKNPPSNKQTKTHVKYFDYVQLYIYNHMNLAMTAPILHGDAFYNIK